MNIELKYISTPAGNVASHDTVVQLANSLTAFNESNAREHDEMRQKMETYEVILDQVFQLSKAISNLSETQQLIRKNLKKIDKKTSEVRSAIDQLAEQIEHLAKRKK